MKQHFGAPWGLKLKLVTALLGLLFLIVMIQEGSAAAAGLLVIALVAAAFGVRGYSVGEGRLTIHRLGWSTTHDLSRLRAADVLASGLPASMRMFGIGGLFSFVGSFRHPDVGWYKAYATDGTKSVLLDLGDEKILVTPDSPRDFAAAVRLQSTYSAP